MQVGRTRGAGWQPLQQGCRCVRLWHYHVGGVDLASALGRLGALAGTALPLAGLPLPHCSFTGPVTKPW